MTQAIKREHIRDLIALLHQLHELHEAMEQTVRARIDAMRRADLAGLQEGQERERALVVRIHEREGLRRQLLERIGHELGLPAGRARDMSVSQLLRRIEPGERPPVVAASDALRRTVSQLARVNRVAAAIAGELVNHLRFVWAAVRPAPQAGSYTPAGLASAADNRIFEATG